MAAAAVTVRPLGGQTVRGELVEESLEAPIEAAFVVLLDESGKQVAAMLTNEAGRFVLRPPAPGRYRLRAERIGYASFTSDELDLSAEQVLDYQLAIPVQPIELAEISVEGERQCDIRRAEGERVAAVWEEARKALSAAVWTEQQRAFRFTTRVWDRLLDPRNLEILEQQDEIKSGLATYPFRALPAQELAERGYARRFDEENVTEYYAPDAQTLLSDLFLDDHCFRIVEGRGETSGMIGLSFEPAKKRDMTDVRGVLWLDARNAHLRYVEYGYENLPAKVRGSDKLGGRLEFRMLPSGAWVVDDWYIRMPVTEVTLEGNPNRVPGSLRVLREKRKLVAIKEEGGAVVGISDPGGTQVGLIGRGSIIGVVFDSTRNAPLAHATVSLLGTNYRTTTDDGGRYSLEYLPPGDFFVTILHARVGMLRLGSALRPVQIRPDENVTLDLAIPSARRLAPMLCPTLVGTGAGIVVGLVTDIASGDVVHGATVSLSTHLRGVLEGSELAEPAAGRTETGFETISDHNGGFLVCGVPTDTQIYAAAAMETEAGTSDGEVVFFTVGADEIHETLLEVALPQPDSEGS